jgi:hypothetical protein
MHLVSWIIISRSEGYSDFYQKRRNNVRAFLNSLGERVLEKQLLYAGIETFIVRI